MATYHRVIELWRRFKPLENLLKSGKTPFFFLDEQGLRSHLEKLRKSSDGKFEFFYVYKTSHLRKICEIVSEFGFGGEAVNLEEMQVAAALGKKIIFNGLDKSDEELKFAAYNQDKVMMILDNFDEILRLKALFPGKRFNAGLRISIRGPWERFGFREDELEKVFLQDNLSIFGLHVHNGIEMYLPYYKNILKLFRKIIIKHKEKMKDLQFVDLGGAFPIGGYRPYGRLENFIAKSAFCQTLFKSFLLPKPSDFRYVDVETFLGSLYEEYKKIILSIDFVKPKLYLEPGRLAISSNVYFCTKVINIKHNNIILDGAYTNLSSIAKEKHIILNLSSNSEPSKLNQAMCFGPLPHVSDFISRYYFGDTIKKGDILLIADTGAYYHAMANDFVRKKAQFFALKINNGLQSLDRIG